MIKILLPKYPENINTLIIFNKSIDSILSLML